MIPEEPIDSQIAKTTEIISTTITPIFRNKS